MSPAALWMIVALAAVGIEIFTVDLTFGLIAVGAGTAGIVAAVGAPLWAPGPSSASASRSPASPSCARSRCGISRRATPLTRTGVDALTGANGRALSRDHEARRPHHAEGRGVVGPTRPDVTSEPVPEGSDVVVTRIDGATALVYPIDPR